MPKRLDPPPWRIRIKRLHESWCAVAGSFFFAESSDPTTHENMQGTHTNAWLSHSEMSQSFIGRLPSTPPQIGSWCSENIQNVGQHSQNVCRILLGDPSEGAPRTFSSCGVQCKAPACLEVFFLFLQVSFWCKWDGDAASLIEICLQQCTCPYDAHGNEKR